MIGEFSVNDSLWYAFSLKKPGCNLLLTGKKLFCLMVCLSDVLTCLKAIIF